MEKPRLYAFGAYLATYSMDIGGYFTRQGGWSRLLSAPSAEIKNAWSYISIVPYVMAQCWNTSINLPLLFWVT
jgi:hypothetical protein